MKKKQWMNLLFFTLIILSGCKKEQEAEERDAYVFKGDTVYINSSGTLKDKIRVSEVRKETHSREVITAGTIQPIPTQFAYIAPPFAGRVTRSYIKLGQQVHVNTPLFEIISPDFTEVQKGFYQAQSERDLAQKDLQRKEDLIRNGVGSQKEYEEALNTLKLNEKEYENAVAALKIYQVNPDNMVLGQGLIIRSPIAGDVLENNVITGQFIHSEADPIAVVANLNQVWVTAQVKEKDIRFIEEGNEMDIYLTANPEFPIKGKVFHIDESVDEETRSIKVLSVCDNKDEKLKLGMYASVHFFANPEEYMVIPEKALLQDENSSFVFVKSAEDTFIKKAVNVDFTKNGNAYVRKGLNEKDIVIEEGGYYLH